MSSTSTATRCVRCSPRRASAGRSGRSTSAGPATWRAASRLTASPWSPRSSRPTASRATSSGSTARGFVEIYVATPLEECERRDVKGLYARARRGEIRNFTGIDDPYEPPDHPELTLDTRALTVDQCVVRVLEIFGGRRTDGSDRDGPSRPAREPERAHPPRGVRQLQEPGHAVVDRQGQHGAAVAGAQGLLRPRADPAGPHRHRLQDPGDDRVPGPARAGVEPDHDLRPEQGGAGGASAPFPTVPSTASPAARRSRPTRSSTP